MKHFTIYDIATGEIVGRQSTGSGSFNPFCLGSGQSCYESDQPTHGATHIINGAPVVIVPPETTEGLREAAKQKRAEMVNSITVVTSTGKTFDGDELSQTRMTRAILGMQAIGRPTITWTLADNTVVEVTVAELIEALCLAGERQALFWPILI